MRVNPVVVRALMDLRQMDENLLAHSLQLSLPALQSWLYDDEPSAVPAPRQLEVLRLLGISDRGPRSDVVHHWVIQEPKVGSVERIYWAVEAMTRAFGRASVVHIARAVDPAFSFYATAKFGLRFNGFVAVLEVRSPALYNIRFDPDRLHGLSWASEERVLLLQDDQLKTVAPGVLDAKGLSDYLRLPLEIAQWQRLAATALNSNVSAEEVVRWFTKNHPSLALVEAKTDTGTPDAEEADALFAPDTGESTASPETKAA